MQRRDGGWGWEERKEEKQQSGCKNKSIKYIHLKKKNWDLVSLAVLRLEPRAWQAGDLPTSELHLARSLLLLRWRVEGAVKTGSL